MLLGGLLLVLADAGAHAAGPWFDIPSGLVVAVLGGPALLLALLLRQRKALR